ncbi:MAG: transglutaminase domain-containing protein [Planctomycetes bacterium]|nr:transglutaminase domain-containing protein [Planctomycetota bacterium]
MTSILCAARPARRGGQRGQTPLRASDAELGQMEDPQRGLTPLRDAGRGGSVCPPHRAAGRRWLAVCWLLLDFPSAVLAQAAPQDPAAEESWEVIYLGEQRMGYSHTTLRTVEGGGGPVVETRNETKLKIKRFGQELKIETTLVTRETPEGDLLGFTMETRNPPAGSSKTIATVEDGRVKLESTVGGRTTTKTVDLEPDVKSPAWQDRLLAKNPLKPGETRSFKTFMPDFNQVATIRLAADDYRETKLLDGQPRKLLRVKITQSVLPTLPITAWLDEQGDTQKTEMSLLGMSMTTYDVPAREAVKELAEAGELDLAVDTLVRVKPIRRPYETRKVVYRVTTPDEDPLAYLVAGDTQTITRIDEHTAELTVSRLELPATSRAPRDVPAEYLSASEYLQTGDERVVEHARRAAPDETNPAGIARRMERYVHDTLTEKDFSTALASAAEVAQSLQGDCTEHAVLLAAMLRTRNIPSRIAVGLVYVDKLSAFGGHMWTEAYLDGKWIPLDATLGQGGIGATHIKLGQSSFADDGPAPVTAFLPLLKILGRLEIEVVKAE